MVVDSTLAFAARRNIPTRYNREHIETTLKAMERISEIRAKRERVFYKKRMAGNKERQRAMDRKLVAENEHLLPRQRASERLAEEAAQKTNEESMEVDVPAQPLKEKRKQKVRQKLLVNGGVENDMDVD